MMQNEQDYAGYKWQWYPVLGLAFHATYSGAIRSGATPHYWTGTQPMTGTNERSLGHGIY